MAKFEIRQAQKSDATPISHLLEQLGYDTAPLKVKSLVSTNDNSNHRIYVAVLDEKAVAVMSIIFFDYFPSAERLCRITSIIVDEKVRGEGVGSKLIDHAKSMALAEKCNVLEVTTSLRRKETQAYYESVGFQKTSYKYVQNLNRIETGKDGKPTQIFKESQND